MSINADAVKLRQTFDKLQTVLINFRKLPLAIVGVKCTSGYYRRTKPFPSNGILVTYDKRDNVTDEVSLLNNDDCFPPFFSSIKVLITLERSGKWGEDLDVISNLKTAFYVDISKRLKVSEKWFGIPTEDQLYLIIDKILFSISIVHQKEISLLVTQEANVSKKLEAQIRWRKYSSTVLRKKFIHKPLISQLLFGLTQRYPIFAETCVYVRKWISWNFLSKMFEGMAIELLVAHLFVNTTSVPKTDLAGFARFVAFLTTHDFISNPVIVDINNSFLPDAINDAKEQFVKRRPALPSLVIITPEDIVGTIFTSLKPEPVVFLRTIKLAAITHEHICATALTNNIYSEFELPEHDFSIYDFVIYLNLNYITTSNEKKSKQYKKANRIKPKCLYLPVVDVDPVKEFVKNLRDNYDSIALFFYNNYSSSAIGVLLRPNIFTQRDAKVITGCHARIKKENILIANFKALMEDFYVIGGKLVRDVIPSEKHTNNI